MLSCCSGLLLDYCPALKEVSVAEVDIESGEHANRQWRVAELHFDSVAVAQEVLPRLPKSTAPDRMKIFALRPIYLMAVSVHSLLFNDTDLNH